MAGEQRTITLPHYRLDEAILVATEEQRWALVDRLLESEGHSRDEIHEVWKENPLTAWCWLVLTVNEIEFDPEVHHPPVHFGIDLGFASAAVNNWIWTIS